MAINYIGPFAFLEIQGNIEALKQEPLVLARPGVDGNAVWRTGQRSNRHTIRTRVDAYNVRSCEDFYALYCDLIGADPVDIMRAGVQLSPHGCLWAVLDVRKVAIRAHVGGSGGLHPPSYGWIDCDWDILAITTDTED